MLILMVPGKILSEMVLLCIVDIYNALVEENAAVVFSTLL